MILSLIDISGCFFIMFRFERNVRIKPERRINSDYPVKPGNDRGGSTGYPVKPGNDRRGSTGYPVKPGNDRGGSTDYPVKSGNDRRGSTDYPVKPGNDRGGSTDNPVKPRNGTEKGHELYGYQSNGGGRTTSEEREGKTRD